MNYMKYNHEEEENNNKRSDLCIKKLDSLSFSLCKHDARIVMRIFAKNQIDVRRRFSTRFFLLFYFTE